MTTTLATLIQQYVATHNELPPGHPDRQHYRQLVRHACEMLHAFRTAQDGQDARPIAVSVRPSTIEVTL